MGRSGVNYGNQFSAVKKIPCHLRGNAEALHEHPHLGKGFQLVNIVSR